MAASVNGTRDRILGAAVSILLGRCREISSSGLRAMHSAAEREAEKIDPHTGSPGHRGEAIAEVIFALQDHESRKGD